MLILTNEIVEIKKNIGKNNITKIFYRVYCDICGTEFKMTKSQYVHLVEHKACSNICSTKIGKNIVKQYNKEVLKCFRTRYNSIKQRCIDINASNYKYYGGRGIKITYASFGEFYKYEFDKFLEAYKKYKNNTSPDRIDVNGNYEPNNIRWIEFKEQASNRRNNKICIGVDSNNNYYEFSNQSQFAKEHGLLHQSISKCLKGIIKQTSGWKFYYKDL